jgi:hypothetical protein
VLTEQRGVVPDPTGDRHDHDLTAEVG